MAPIATFANRKDGGQHLAKLLDKYKDQEALVLGIPRGGIEVAFEVATALHAELSVAITKKLPHPLQPELAIGAAAEDGSVFLNSMAQDLPSDEVKRILQQQISEIKSRVQRFRKGKLLPDMRGRIVILVDDGIATGSTVVPAIKLCKANKAAKVVVASPVSGQKYVKEIDAFADEVVIAVRAQNLSAVGEAYKHFPPLAEVDALAILDRFTRFASRSLH